MKSKYMIGTIAIAKLGDISRKEGSLCQIHGEEGDDYIGNWITGFGFFDVKFPKSTTRELTEEEIEKYDGMKLAISDQYFGEVKIKD